MDELFYYQKYELTISLNTGDKSELFNAICLKHSHGILILPNNYIRNRYLHLAWTGYI